jgi:farnesyl-diphosphate farnesyltransferase
MRVLGREYGCGLQLINILRDTHSDLQDGRCYLPADELAEAGLSPDRVLAQPEIVMPVIERWLAKAKSGLEEGMEYADATNYRRVRIATALPALIGIHTIKELHAGGSRVLHHKIKIARHQVRRILLRASVSFGSRRVLRQLFEAA